MTPNVRQQGREPQLSRQWIVAGNKAIFQVFSAKPARFHMPSRSPRFSSGSRLNDARSPVSPASPFAMDHPMTTKLAIFDFDGTLADTYPVAVGLYQ